MDSVKSATALQISKDDLVKICDNYSMNLKKCEKMCKFEFPHKNNFREKISNSPPPF